MRYPLPKNYTPTIPTTERDSYYYNLWWLNHVANYGKNTSIGRGKQKKAMTEKQKADRKRFFITQAQKNKNPKYGIPTSSQHKEFFKNHQGAKSGGKAKAKTKHLDTPVQRNEDPDEGPAPKQQKVQDEHIDPDELEKVMSRENDIQMEEAETSGIPMELSAEDIGGGGGGGGGGGIGHSTGNWNCETIWGDKSCTTYASRHCVCLMRDQDMYTLIGNTTNTQKLDTENTTSWAGFSTPWNYLDFNQYCIHFAPRDWQKLVNGYTRWRPKSINVKIFNIQVIQKTTTDAGVQYSNDLTGTIQIFADQEGRYPRILYPNQTTLMGPFPNQIYYLPQFAYMTNNGGTGSGIVDLLSHKSGFYCLDESPSEMLRTGNEWASSYAFDPNTQWVSNKQSSINITKRANPLYDTWEVNGRGGDALRGNFSTWRSPWYPGPNIALTDTTAAGQDLTDIPNVMVGSGGMPLAPGMPMYRPEADKDEYLHTFWVPKKVNMNEGDIRDDQISESTAYKVQISTSNLYNVAPASVYSSGLSQGTIAPEAWGAMLPGMIWDNRPPTYFDPIWQQFPETDEQFKIVSQLGGIPMNKSPGHIFVKVTPKPTGEANGLINEYATFTCTVSIEWELEPYTTHRWNMRGLVSYGINDARSGTQMPDASGAYNWNPTVDVTNRLYIGKQVLRTN